MKAKYINPFVDASMNLFKEYLEVDCSAGKPYLNKQPDQLHEVSGIIGLAGESKGAIVISFPRETAITMASRMAGKKYFSLTDDVLDIIGEFANIIAGNAKKDLLEFKLVISLPGVIVGNSGRLKWPDGVPVVSIPFESELGYFNVNVSLKS